MPVYRGGNGWFSLRRHGVQGQGVAEAFSKEMGKEKDAKQAIERINGFLSESDTRYHRHSFASFLLDELKKIDQSPRSTFNPDETNHYDKSQVVAALKASF